MLPLRIVQMVRALRIVVSATLLLIPLQFLLYWSNPEFLGFADRDLPAGAVWSQLDATRQWGVISMSALPQLVAWWAFWSLWRLLDCYARGQVFAVAPIRHMAGIGRAWMLWVVLNIAMDMAISAWVTWDRPTGQRSIEIELGGDALIAFLLGATLWVMSWVMNAAQQAVQENEQFV